MSEQAAPLRLQQLLDKATADPALLQRLSIALSALSVPDRR